MMLWHHIAAASYHLIEMCKWVKKTASARFEVDMQSAFQENFSDTMASRGLLGGGSVMRAFAVTTEMSRGGVLVVSAAAFASSAATSLLGMLLRRRAVNISQSLDQTIYVMP